MIDVKVVRSGPAPAEVEPHVLALVGRLLEVARLTLLAQDVDGLRPSHFRLLSHVPEDGVTITELAAALTVTKQGVGQLVTHLQGTGHVEVTTDHADRRRRVVRRTARGDDFVTRSNQTVAAVERHWERQVGAERYAVFREVLSEIAEAGT